MTDKYGKTIRLPEYVYAWAQAEAREQCLRPQDVIQRVWRRGLEAIESDKLLVRPRLQKKESET
jgi:hypothetical protein